MTKIAPRSLAELSPEMGLVLLIGPSNVPGQGSRALTGRRKENGVIVTHDGHIPFLSDFDPTSFIEIPYDEGSALAPEARPCQSGLESHYLAVRNIALHTSKMFGDDEALRRIGAMIEQGPSVEMVAGSTADAIDALQGSFGLLKRDSDSDAGTKMFKLSEIFTQYDPRVRSEVLRSMEADELYLVSIDDLKPEEAFARVARLVDAAPVIGAATAVTALIEFIRHLGDVYSESDPYDVALNEVSTILDSSEHLDPDHLLGRIRAVIDACRDGHEAPGAV
jgi:hypothetical protein